MKIELQTRWLTSDPNYPEMEPLLFRLLEMIDDNISLRQAAAAENVSYRHAWGILKKWEEAFHQPLIKTRRGRSGNNQLTEFGSELLQLYLLSKKEHADALNQSAIKINKTLAIDSEKRTKPIRFFASHDLAVTKLTELLKTQLQDQLITQTHGSLEAIKLFAQKQCDIIGFHYPLNKEFANLKQEYQQHLQTIDCEFIELAIRTQGLLISKNNPKKIRSIEDLSKRSVRFINRQAGSGTRILFDALLKQKKMTAKDINGYQQEEFTHLAVAAMIASGAADVGMGIEAVSKDFNLEFIPIVKERYVIAIRKDISKNLQNQFYTSLESKLFMDYVLKLHGYESDNLTNKISLQELFQ